MIPLSCLRVCLPGRHQIRTVGRLKILGVGGFDCVLKWGFMGTFPGKQDVIVNVNVRSYVKLGGQLIVWCGPITWRHLLFCQNLVGKLLTLPTLSFFDNVVVFLTSLSAISQSVSYRRFYQCVNPWKKLSNVWFVKIQTIHNLSLWLYEYFWIISLYASFQWSWHEKFAIWNEDLPKKS